MMEERFDVIRAIRELKNLKRIAHVDWYGHESVGIGVDGRLYDEDGDEVGLYIPPGDLEANVWKVYNGVGHDFVQGPLELIRSLGSGAWKYATIVDNDAWGPDDKIVLRGGDTLEWQGGEGIPMFKTMLEAKFQLHK